jgi:hypothetical protein
MAVDAGIAAARKRPLRRYERQNAHSYRYDNSENHAHTPHAATLHGLVSHLHRATFRA